jgi:hypothetical protein
MFPDFLRKPHSIELIADRSVPTFYRGTLGIKHFNAYKSPYHNPKLFHQIPPFLNLCLKSWNQLHYMVM